MSHRQKHKVVPGEISERELCQIREAVCVQVEKIYDSCREKDCIEDARVLFWQRDIKHLLHKAINVKARKAVVKDVYADIEPVPFKRGFYTVDVKFFIKVTLDFFVPCGPCGKIVPVSRSGLVMFDKKVVLFGSDGGIKIFKAHYTEDGQDSPIRARLQQDNLPISKIEVAEPIALNAGFVKVRGEGCDPCRDRDMIPPALLSEITESEGLSEEPVGEVEEMGHQHENPTRGVVVSIGLFSIIKLVRFVQLLLPAFDFCYPVKECVASTDENPCDLFDSITFPFEEFYPPQKFDFPGAEETESELRGDEDRHHTHEAE